MRFVLRFPEQHRDVADGLDQLRARCRAERIDYRAPGCAVIRVHPDLDQRMVVEGLLQSRQQTSGYPRRANDNHRFEPVGAGAQPAPGGGRNRGVGALVRRFGQQFGVAIGFGPSPYMSRGKRNRSWLKEHQRDNYVQSARRGGYRSRAAYKLIQLDERDRLFRRGDVVIDLGAAPGGWSQVAAERVGDSGRVLALDRLVLKPLEGVEFVQGDFLDAAVAERLRTLMGTQRADVVMSDMAPNISGIRDADQARSLNLALGALAFAEDVLKPSGTFVVKAFHGDTLEEIKDQVRRKFASVVVRKPGASRDKSSEIYLLARGYGV